MKLIHIASLLAVALTGCATTNSQQEIDYAAKLHFSSQLCAHKGLMDQETAAKGMALANKQVYSSESQRVNAKMQEYRSQYSSLSQSQCNDTRLHILERMASTSMETPAPAYQQPKTTNCSTYFGQTHCYSF